MNVTPCCSNITIELSPDVALYQSDVAGEYVPIDKFSAGRHIYQHKFRNLFLSIAGHTAWEVRNEVGRDGNAYIRSPSAGSLCPADQRNNYNNFFGLKSWLYKDGDYDVLEAGPGNIRLTCTSHN